MKIEIEAMTFLTGSIYGLNNDDESFFQRLGGGNSCTRDVITLSLEAIGTEPSIFLYQEQ